ncbi:MAG TPA: sialidase family protein [Microlunatus sp.]
MNHRRASLATLGICAILLSGPAAAAADPGSPRVSGPSPYTACTAAGSGDLYPDAEVEVNVASDPAKPGHLIAVWQQDRFSNGGSRGIVAASSQDAGRSWSRTTLPFNRCAPGGLDYARASNPVVSFGPDGTAYAAALTLDSGSSPRFGVASAVSRDGGRSWDTVRLLVQDDDGGTDKPWITADPRRPGTAYAVWDDVTFGDGDHFRGPAYFSKTIDFGSTWSKPSAIAGTGDDESTLGNQILVDRQTGRLYDTYAFNECICASILKVAYVYSDDGGRTWSRQRVIADLLTVGIAQPGNRTNLRTPTYPSAAISADGKIFLTWQDSRFSGGSYDEIAVAMTKDRGEHWSTPRRANEPTGRASFAPAVAIDAHGVVAVTYYDLRSDDLTDRAFSVDAWATTTRDGVRFRGDLHLGGSFDILAAPFANGYFLGDYQGLAAAGQTFVAAFVKSNCGADGCTDNRTDVYSARFSRTLGDRGHTSRTGATGR